jgi:hypothetical protein
VEQERADAVFFPAQWPETWSYTLSAAIDAGLPILATDLGAFPERLAGVAGARIVAWDAPAAQINDALLALAGGAPPASGSAAGDDGAAYRDRLLGGVNPVPGDAAACLAFAGGRALEPEETLPRATLVELFDDGVRSGNGRSTAELRERLPAADREIESARAARERAAQAESALAQAHAREETLASELAALRDEAGRAARHAAELESSTSWRLTAPLRALARLFGR